MTSRTLTTVALQLWALYTLMSDAIFVAFMPVYLGHSYGDELFRIAMNRELARSLFSGGASVVLLWKARSLSRVLVSAQGEQSLTGRSAFEAALVCTGVATLIPALGGLIGLLVFPVAEWADPVGWDSRGEMHSVLAVSLAAALAVVAPRIFTRWRGRRRGASR